MPVPPPERKKTQREMVLDEIMKTEVDYLRDLEIIVTMQKLMSTDESIRDFVTSDDLSAIFSNVTQLFQVRTSVKTANDHSPYFPFSFI